jgi:hypothetical protein
MRQLEGPAQQSVSKPVAMEVKQKPPAEKAEANGTARQPYSIQTVRCSEYMLTGDTTLITLQLPVYASCAYWRWSRRLPEVLNSLMALPAPPMAFVLRSRQGVCRLRFVAPL